MKTSIAFSEFEVIRQRALGQVARKQFTHQEDSRVSSLKLEAADGRHVQASCNWMSGDATLSETKKAELEAALVEIAVADLTLAMVQAEGYINGFEIDMSR